MKGKKIGGIVLLIIGIVLLVLGFYVKNRVDSAQASIGKAGLFSSGPASKVVEALTETQVAKYRKIYQWSFGGGILLSIVGAGMIATSKKKR